MKAKRWLGSGLLLLLSVLLISCGTSSPSELSSPSEESSEVISPVSEDPNAKTARAYLEEWLAEEQETGTVEWLTEERAETVRECVKKLKTPILTEEDVFHIAERAISVVSAEQTQSQMLPPCGVLASVSWSPMLDPDSGEAFYTSLVAYTLYLFTPPDFVFREDELWGRTSLTSSPMLYLPLKSDYTSRQEALTMLREGKNGVSLLLSGFVNGEQPLDCSLCGTSVLFRESGEVLTLDLFELAKQGDIALPEHFLTARAEAYVLDWMERIVSFNAGVYSDHECSSGDRLSVYQPLSAEDAQALREMVERLPAPILTEEMVRRLEAFLYRVVDSASLLLFPGVDGEEDVLLPSDVDSLREYLIWENSMAIDVKAHCATAYLLDLFTPSAYRYTDPFRIGEVSYALDEYRAGGSVWTPAEPIFFALITEAYKSGEEDILFVRVEEPMEEQTE